MVLGILVRSVHVSVDTSSWYYGSGSSLLIFFSMVFFLRYRDDQKHAKQLTNTGVIADHLANQIDPELPEGSDYVLVTVRKGEEAVTITSFQTDEPVVRELISGVERMLIQGESFPAFLRTYATALEMKTSTPPGV
jgi:hypothetical protein